VHREGEACRLECRTWEKDPSWVSTLELTTMRKAAKWQIYLPLMRSVKIIVFFVSMNLQL
jgi:hypothetical protein